MTSSWQQSLFNKVSLSYLTFTLTAQKLDYVRNRIRDEIGGRWLNQTIAFNSVISAPLTSLCLKAPEWHSGGGERERERQLASVSTLVLVQRAAGASRSSFSGVADGVCLCFCTEPCDCRVAKSMAKPRSGHLQISVCGAWVPMFLGCPNLSSFFLFCLKLLASV